MHRLFLSLGFLVALSVAARAEDAGKLACSIGSSMTFEAGKAACLLNIRGNWLVCTGVANAAGKAQWQDTGVPCKEPAPQSPANYRPVAGDPQPGPRPAEPKHVIDLFRGIVFRCSPSVHISWSTDACSKITAEFVSEAKAAGITVVVIDPSDDDAAKAKKAEAGGLKLDDAIDWSVMLRATDTGGAIFKQDVDGVMEVLPGLYDRRSLLIVSDAYLHPATAEHALDEAKTDFPGQIQYFTQ